MESSTSTNNSGSLGLKTLSVKGCQIIKSGFSACLEVNYVPNCSSIKEIYCSCGEGMEMTQSGCVPCPTNTYSTSGKCNPCKVHETAPEGSSKCNCPPGTYRNQEDMTCKLCYSGWFSEIGSDNCTKCPEGSLDMGAGMGRCVAKENKVEKEEDREDREDKKAQAALVLSSLALVLSSLALIVFLWAALWKKREEYLPSALDTSPGKVAMETVEQGGLSRSNIYEEECVYERDLSH